MEDKIERLYNEFCQKHSYVVVEKRVVADFLKLGGNEDLDLLLDYILANDLAEEIVL